MGQNRAINIRDGNTRGRQVELENLNIQNKIKDGGNKGVRYKNIYICGSFHDQRVHECVCHKVSHCIKKSNYVLILTDNNCQFEEFHQWWRSGSGVNGYALSHSAILNVNAITTLCDNEMNLTQLPKNDGQFFVVAPDEGFLVIQVKTCKRLSFPSSVQLSFATLTSQVYSVTAFAISTISESSRHSSISAMRVLNQNQAFSHPLCLIADDKYSEGSLTSTYRLGKLPVWSEMHPSSTVRPGVYRIELLRVFLTAKEDKFDSNLFFASLFFLMTRNLGQGMASLMIAQRKCEGYRVVSRFRVSRYEKLLDRKDDESDRDECHNWLQKMTYSEHYDTYVSYVKRHYGTHCCVVFDGYGNIPSTKDMEQKRRGTNKYRAFIYIGTLDRNTPMRPSTTLNSFNPSFSGPLAWNMAQSKTNNNCLNHWTTLQNCSSFLNTFSHLCRSEISDFGDVNKGIEIIQTQAVLIYVNSLDMRNEVTESEEQIFQELWNGGRTRLILPLHQA
ncbi:hypothetical protein GQR58_004738 [Nymphon striatum]|nr:hypothetical protein GQR58_004738 [Nymphon striatum]